MKFLRPSAFLFLAAAAISLSAQQPAAPAAPAVPPAPDPIEGMWTGTVSGPQGGDTAIGFEFLRTKRGTLIFGKMYFPAMFTYGHMFAIPVEIGGHGDYKVTPAFDIVLHLAGDELTGTFGRGLMPLKMKRGGTMPGKPPLPQHAAAPAPLWSYSMDGATWAPPAVSEDTVYVGTSTGKFHAVAAADGRGLWTWSGANGFDGLAVIGADTVYAVDTKINLVALNRADGTLRWSTPLHDEKIAGKPVPDNPTFNHRAAIPLLLDGVIYVGSSDGGLYAVDAKTGEKLWRHEAKAPIFSGVGRHGADILTFGTMDGSIVFLDRHSRQETFRAKVAGGVVTIPLVVGDKVIVGSRDYMLYALKLSDGSPAWRFSYWFSWVESTPVLRDGLIYVGASDYSRVTVLDPETGRQQWATEVHGMNWGSPLVTDDMVFTGTASQTVEGTVIDHLGGVIALDRRTGTVKWWMTSPKSTHGFFGGYAGSLALAGDKVIAAGFDGKLIALPAK